MTDPDSYEEKGEREWIVVYDTVLLHELRVLVILRIHGGGNSRKEALWEGERGLMRSSWAVTPVCRRSSLLWVAQLCSSILLPCVLLSFHWNWGDGEQRVWVIQKSQQWERNKNERETKTEEKRVVFCQQRKTVVWYSNPCIGPFFHWNNFVIGILIWFFVDLFPFYGFFFHASFLWLILVFLLINELKKQQNDVNWIMHEIAICFIEDFLIYRNHNQSDSL